MNTPGPASVEQRALARRELSRRRREGGVRYFEPQAQQLPVLQCRKRGCLVLGGNRSGKTTVGGADAAMRLLGEHPYRTVHRPPIKIWVASQDLPGRVRAKGDGDQEIHKQLEELRRWIPREALKGGAWGTAFSPGELTVSLRNGSLAVFKGYSQGPLKFESDAIHHIWFDEEPEDKTIWSSCLLRLADHDGDWMITATPVLSLLGAGWIEELWDRRDAPQCGYEAHQLFSYDNPYLSAAVLHELFGGLSDEERLVRETGAFARLGGRVLSEFDPRVHLVPDYIPARGLAHYLIIDPGWNTAGHLFAAVDKRGRITLYGEHYAQREPIPVRMRVLHELWKAFGKPEYDVIADSAAFAKTRQGGTERETPSDIDEYLAAAREIGAEWFWPRPCEKGDPMAYRVKRYLRHRKLFVCRGLKWWQWECERWTRQKERSGPRSMELPVPDAPIRRNDHLLDCTRYLCNLLPEAEPEPGDVSFDPMREHWRRSLGEEGEVTVI